MRFICNANTIIESLQVVTKALPARTPNQVLEGILIETDMNEIIMTCSDERIAIITRFTADVQEPGRGVVPGKLFNEVIRRLNDTDIEITMSNRFMFRIEGGGSRTNIAGFDADLYPRLPQVEREQEVAMPQDMLRDMISKTEFAIAAEDMREVLTGCLLEIDNGSITMVALDGYRMAMVTNRSSDVLPSFKAIIPGRAVGDIGKLLSDDPEALCTLAYGGGKLHVRLDKTDIFVVLINGEYVRYRSILPTSFNTTVGVELSALRRSIDRAALIAREGNNNLLIFKIADQQMSIESHSEIGDVFEQLPVEQTGPDINIAFNVKYLIDVVRNVSAARVLIKLNTPIQPCVIVPMTDLGEVDDYLHLVLPVRTGLTNS